MRKESRFFNKLWVFLGHSGVSLMCFALLTFSSYAEQCTLGDNCAPDPKSCIPMIRSWEGNCTDKDMDKISCAMYKNYAEGIKMVVPGDSDTEGAYIKCDSGVSLEECLTQGKFQEVNTLAEATLSSKVAMTSTGATLVRDGQICHCPLMRCNARTEDLKFKPIGYDRSTILPDLYKTLQVGDNLCLMLRTTVGYVHVGCKEYKNIEVPPGQAVSTSCFAKTSCTSFGQHSSKVFWSVTSRIVECVQDMLDLVFFNEMCNEGKNALPSLQSNLRMPVLIAILLYIMLLGIKIVNSGELIQKSEMFTAILKIGLVLYLVVGSNSPNSGYTSGLSTVFDAGKSTMNSLSQYVIGASSTTGLCYYNPDTYQDKTSNNKTVSTSYIALWDALDCRIAYYLGLYRLTPVSEGGSPTTYGVLSVIIPALFSLEIVFVILLILYAVCMLVFVIFFVHFYVVCLIMLAISVYIGVIIVPMILFDYTKQFFDKWVKLIISYSIQPVIVTGFLALSFLVFDNVMFGNCKFTEDKVNNYSYWSIDQDITCNGMVDPITGIIDPRCNTRDKAICSARNSCVSDSSTSQDCKNTIGYVFLKGLSENALQTVHGMFFDYTALNGELASKMPDLIVAVLKLLLFAYFFLLFSENLSAFASELTDGINIGKYVLTAQKIFEEMKKAAGGKKGGGGQKQQQPKKDDKGGGGKSARGGVSVSGGAGKGGGGGAPGGGGGVPGGGGGK